MIINDMDISGLFRVFDSRSGHFIFSFLDRSAPGDVPPDIALLPVRSTRFVGTVLIIETEV